MQLAQLKDKNLIEVGTYKKHFTKGMFSTQLPNIVITQIVGEQVTCTIGGDIVQTITRDQALAFIDSSGGYKE